MLCKGTLIFKSIDKKEGGTFKNDKGQDVNYDSSYIIKVDEVKGKDVNERKFKFPQTNKVLFESFSEIEPYTKVDITFDVEINTKTCKLVPVDVTTEIED